MIGRTISHYKIVDKLGEGGMGAVYKAEDTTLNRLVAIKALSSHLAENDEAQKRFVREAQAASSLNHPNITTVYEFLEDEDTRLICMEYVEGKTIRDMVESGVVSVRKAIDIIMQAAEALDAAHNKGILHRDVKSANIMVNMEGRVKVMDFGLAHLEERSQLTRTGTTMGTLSYSSPEQISGKPAHFSMDGRLMNKSTIPSLLAVVLLCAACLACAAVSQQPAIGGASQPDWANICETPARVDCPYCVDVGKNAYNATGARALRNVNLGKIIGVSWRPEGSLIGISPAIPSAGIPEEIRFSPRNAFYYIIDNGGGRPFLRQCREIIAR